MGARPAKAYRLTISLQQLRMTEFLPIEQVEDSALILDDGQWPNFHDA